MQYLIAMIMIFNLLRYDWLLRQSRGLLSQCTLVGMLNFII